MENGSAKIAVAVAAGGLVCNFLLAGAKIAAGFLTGLLSVSADGFNNLSDCGSCAVALVALRLSGKPADREHPYGHQRTEYIASLCIACLILALSATLLKDSVESFFLGVRAAQDLWVYIVLAVSVAAKLLLFFLYRRAAIRADSDSLKAASLDSACDCLATLVAAAGAFVTQKTGFPADGAAGILLSLFIALQGVKLLKEATSSLLGKAPDPALVAAVKALVRAREGVLGLHDLRVYSYGKSHIFATVHIEMDAKLSSVKAHETLDSVEREAKARLGVELTAHLDPVALDDAEMFRLEREVKEAAEKIYPGLDVHDFRLIRGETETCVFEVGVPYACPLGDDEVREALLRAVADRLPKETVISVERE